MDTAGYTDTKNDTQKCVRKIIAVVNRIGPIDYSRVLLE